MNSSKVKAVALLSGGLDSTLAVKLMIDQGIEVYALNFTSAFCTCNAGAKKQGNGEHATAHAGGGCKSESKRVAEEFGIPIKVMTKGFDYIEIVRNARHGYGKGMNPCVDCRIYMFKLAKKYMEDIGASFIITGEVLGQRPMSQRKDAFRVIERESGLEGLILRPLCAKHLDPTLAEKEGLVDRERLLDVLGRSRKVQIELAEDLGVDDYPCPSGGCLLTDKIFSKKVRDLLVNKKDVSKTDLSLLKSGRHFRHNGAKIIVGKNEADNMKLRLSHEGYSLMEPVDFSGPVALFDETANNGEIDCAASLILKYAHSEPGQKRTLKVARRGQPDELIERDAPMDDCVLESIRVC